MFSYVAFCYKLAAVALFSICFLITTIASELATDKTENKTF